MIIMIILNVLSRFGWRFYPFIIDHFGKPGVTPPKWYHQFTPPRCVLLDDWCLHIPTHKVLTHVSSQYNDSAAVVAPYKAITKPLIYKFHLNIRACTVFLPPIKLICTPHYTLVVSLSLSSSTRRILPLEGSSKASHDSWSYLIVNIPEEPTDHWLISMCIYRYTYIYI